MIVTILRTAILYSFVTVGIRLMGKRQIGDMQPNELVVTLLISEIAAIPLQDSNQPILYGVTAIFVLVVLEIFISVLSMKSFLVRKLMSGKSVVIIKNGEIDQQAMKNVRMTVLDLIELLRGQEVFDISTVAFAVLEVNGQLSVLLNTGNQPVTASDAGIKVHPAGLQLPVVSDGRVVYESLTALGSSEDEIDRMLKEISLTSDEILLMTLDRYGNRNIIKKGEHL